MQRARSVVPLRPTSPAVRPAIVREWRRYERMLGPAGQVALDQARLAVGERVLDVGCGVGGMTLQAAHRVRSRGLAVGLDADPSAIEVAAARASEQRLEWVRFSTLGAAPSTLRQPAFDAMIGRFRIAGVRTSVLGRLAATLVPGGRLAFVCWRRPADNDWFTLPRRVLADVLGADAFGAADGSFGLSERAVLERRVARAGFSEPRIEPFDFDLWVGDDVDDAVELFFEGDGRSLDVSVDDAGLFRVTQALRRAYAEHAGPDGVRLRAAAWLVGARWTGPVTWAA